MRDSASNLDRGANYQVEAEAFAYPTWRLLPQLIAFAFCAALILVAVIDGRGHGSLAARVGLSLVGVWGLLYVVRRLKNPRRVIVGRESLSACYWLGPQRTWSLDGLTVRTPSPGAVWENSVVVESRSGTEAFRLYRDLPGLKRLCFLLSK